MDPIMTLVEVTVGGFGGISWGDEPEHKSIKPQQYKRKSKEPLLLLGTVVVNGNHYAIPLEWPQNNGILIAGLSGSGKSATASFYLNQYAWQGVQLIICDYDSPMDEEETLSCRVAHLEKSFYLPPVSAPEDIKRYMGLLSEEYKRRLADPTRRFPLMLVLDEVSAFLSYIKDDKPKKGEPDPIATFARELLQMRKVNIRSIIIGQEYSSGFSTQLMRPIRSAFRVKILHQLDAPNIKMVMDYPSSDIARRIGSQKTGEVYYDGRFMKVPLLTAEAKEKTKKKLEGFDYPGRDTAATIPVEAPEKLTERPLTPERQIVGQMIDRYSAGKAAGYDLKTKEDLMRFLIWRGYSKRYILANMAGNKTMLGEMYERIIAENR